MRTLHDSELDTVAAGTARPPARCLPKPKFYSKPSIVVSTPTIVKGDNNFTVGGIGNTVEGNTNIGGDYTALTV